MPAINAAAEIGPARMRDPMVHDLHVRVSRIEDHISTTRDREQVRATELAVLKNDVEYVKDSVGSIQQGINRILWAIGLSAIAAATTFVLSGGLVIVQQ